MDRQSLEPGLMLFIKKKLEHAVPLREITDMLLRAGFSTKQIEEAVREVRNKFPSTHQDIVASNSFLPPLRKKDVAEEEVPVPKMHSPKEVKKGMFRGRIRRRDFILGFLLFFGVGVVSLCFILGLFSYIFSDFPQFLEEIMSPERNGIWILLLPVVLSPVTFLLLSLITRRLHDLSLPGGIAFGFLIFFVDPLNGVLSMYGVVVLQAMMICIFVLLLAERGVQKNNQHGAPPSIKGSTFAKIFNS